MTLLTGKCDKCGEVQPDSAGCSHASCGGMFLTLNVVTKGFDTFGDRYKYDALYQRADGWAQIDSKQDAWYYGQWINPITFKLFTYCEHDTCLTECANEADFIAMARECVDWNKNAGYFEGIDAMADPPIHEAFTRMGLAEFLH